MRCLLARTATQPTIPHADIFHRKGDRRPFSWTAQGNWRRIVLAFGFFCCSLRSLEVRVLVSGVYFFGTSVRRQGEQGKSQFHGVGVSASRSSARLSCACIPCVSTRMSGQRGLVRHIPQCGHRAPNVHQLEPLVRACGLLFGGVSELRGGALNVDFTGFRPSPFRFMRCSCVPIISAEKACHEQNCLEPRSPCLSMSLRRRWSSVIRTTENTWRAVLCTAVMLSRRRSTFPCPRPGRSASLRLWTGGRRASSARSTIRDQPWCQEESWQK